MSDNIEFSFSEKTDGIIWKTLADPENKRLYLEIRNIERKQVFFSALDLAHNAWIWKNITFDETWWINLQSVAGNVLLFTLYTDENNPDKKGVFAYDVHRKVNLWWRNNFAITSISGGQVIGVDTKFGGKEMRLNLSDGSEISPDSYVFAGEQNFMTIRPFQYQEGNTHFATIKGFLEMKCQISPIISIEYCEYRSLIFISAFVNPNDLANYLFVFNSSGELVLKETLGEHLKGIALDAFFIFSGYLIFVKNKCELVSYKFV